MTKTHEHIEVVIVGGGQAGLALSYYLKQQGRQHVIVEQARLWEAWRSGRWDSFALITPNARTFTLPGLPYEGDKLIALGGGVIGDLAGFAAATYQRGMPLVQIPTTLLAQVDSSVGGKTAVNHPLGKNMIGAFYQPSAVIIDSATLSTLPDREYASGLAEVVKYGAIRSPELFAWLESNVELLRGRDDAALTQAIHESCRIKAEIVAADERETGERALLNFGHTFGHAIEVWHRVRHLAARRSGGRRNGACRGAFGSRDGNAGRGKRAAAATLVPVRARRRHLRALIQDRRVGAGFDRRGRRPGRQIADR